MDKVEQVARLIAYSHGYVPEKVPMDLLREMPISGENSATADLMAIAKIIIDAVERQ